MEEQDTNDYYIGWKDALPEGHRGPVRRVIIVTILVGLLAAIMLVVGQRGFQDSHFELGQLSEVSGILVDNPVPMLRVTENGSTKNWLLVGFGKHGAEATVTEMEASAGHALTGYEVRLRGTRIYYQDRTVLELTEGEAALVEVLSQTQTNARPPGQALGDVSLVGEILDPKCALGVMKPGEGKPHRSCAVRCIAGGVPPIFRITDQAGNKNYCLLRGSEKGAINQGVLPFVADQVRLCGKLERQEDWLVLYLNPEEDILRLKPHWVEGEIPRCAPSK